MRVTIRPAEDADLPRLVEIVNTTFPDYPMSLEEIRHFDAIWDYTRYQRFRFVAVAESGLTVGVSDTHHMTSQFHPQKYWMDI